MKPAETTLSTPCSPCLRSYTPPDSPRVHTSPQAGTHERSERALEKFVQVLEKADPTNKPEDVKPEATKDVESEKPKARASKLEYKLVDEMYVIYSVAMILLTLYHSAGMIVPLSIKSWSQQRRQKR